MNNGKNGREAVSQVLEGANFCGKLNLNAQYFLLHN